MSAERRRGLLMGFVGGAAVALALAAATIAIEGGFGESDPTSEAVDVIQQDYFKSVNESQLDDASIDGMVRALRMIGDHDVPLRLDRDRAGARHGHGPGVEIQALRLEGQGLGPNLRSDSTRHGRGE